MSNININYNIFDDVHSNNQEQEQDHYHATNTSPLYANTFTQYKELYTNTNTHLATQKKYRFVKDVNKPFTYYSVSVNDDDDDDGLFNEYSDPRDYSENNRPKPSFEEDGCVKLYLCGLVGCCLLCSFGCKHV